MYGRTLFYSGEFRKWNKTVYARTTKTVARTRVLIRGLRQAISDPLFSQITVKINHVPINDYKIVGDRLVLSVPLEPTQEIRKSWFGLISKLCGKPAMYVVDVQVQYKDLEGSKWI